MFRTSGRNGSPRRLRRVQRRQPRLAIIPRTCSTRSTRAGTSQRDVPAIVRHGLARRSSTKAAGHPQGFKIKTLSQNAGKFLKVNQSGYKRIKGKKLQFFYPPTYVKSLGNQAKTFKKTAQNRPKNTRILNHFPRLLIIKQKYKPSPRVPPSSDLCAADCGL